MILTIFILETDPMKSYFGSFQQQGLIATETTVLVFEKNLSIGYKSASGGNAMISWLIRDLEARFDPAAAVTVIRNREQPGELRIEGPDAAKFIGELQAEQQKPWHRKPNGKEWIRNSLLVAALLGLLFLLYLLLVPWISQQLASKVSVKTERQMGDAVYDAMGLSGSEDTVASRSLNEFFRAMAVPSAYDIRITVVNGPVINAFALPGGRIVVYKALLEKIQSYPELAALLGHEFTHIQNRHATKSIFRRLGSKVFLGLLFGRVGAVTTVLVNHADNLKHLTYSRKLEKEADMDGLAILLDRKIDPAGFSDLFRHLKEAAPASGLPEFLGSHPDTDKRIRYIREAAAGAPVREDDGLNAIFMQLKQP